MNKKLGSHEDLVVQYPATSMQIKRSGVLHSKAFARQLDVLISQEFEEAMPKSQKAREVVKEIRDVCDTRFISGWLPALLVTQESTQSFGDIPQINKKIRDSVVHNLLHFHYSQNTSRRQIVSFQVYENGLRPFRRSGMWTTAKVVLQISLTRDLDDVLGLFIYKIIIIKLMLKFLESSKFPAVESTGIEMLKKVRQ